MEPEEHRRKLVAVLAADVAAYTRLMGADEDATMAAWWSHRKEVIDPAIAAQRGRIVKHTGDGFLAEFPSVLDAVRCAVRAQEELARRNQDVPADKRMEFRMGINLCDILTDDEDIYGDGVNIAARLESLAEPGGLVVSGSVHDQVRGKLDLAWDDMGERKVKNIAQPVRAFRLRTGGRATLGPPGRRRVTPALAMAAGAAAVVFAVAASWLVYDWLRPPPGIAVSEAPALPDVPSIVVLPFANLSGDREQEYFSDGITEDLIIDLSKLSGLMVIARNTSFTFKGRAVNVPEVAKELGVRYVLEGSVRASGGRVRINAQLIDAQTGGHLWAERFDRELGDIFTLQDDVTEKIVSALAIKITKGEKENLRRTDRNTTPETYDVFLRGLEALHRFTPEGIEDSRDYFLRAIAMDPAYARAYAALGFTYTVSALFYRLDDWEEMIRQSLKYARKAIELDDTLPQGHFTMSVAFLRQGRHTDAIAAARRAIKHDPNYADGYAVLANVLAYAGEGAEAKREIQKAMTLNPRYSATYVEILGRAHFVMGEYDAAIKLLQKCVSRDPTYLICRMLLASAYGLTGEVKQAEWEVEEVRNLMPGFSLQRRNTTSQFLKAKDKQRYISGLRRAGVPEKPGSVGDTDKPSIAVLPFANLSGDKEQEYFSDGMTEDLITDLSQISGLFVIARNSVFTYKGRAVKVQEVARDLGVSHVLEGSVRRVGNRVRINAQLIDAATGRHLWAERFDRDLTDVFALQDEVTQKIVAALAVTLTRGEERRLNRATRANPEAYDMLLRGLEFFRRFTQETNAEAQEFFRKAAALDPTYARAYADLALSHSMDIQFGWTKTSEPHLAKALELAKTALALDESLPQVHFALGSVYRVMREFDKAKAAAGRSLELDPNYADGYAQLAQTLVHTGLAEESIAAISKAMRLNPRHPFFYVWILGHAHFIEKRYEAAITQFKKVLDRNPSFPGARRLLAASYAHLGRLDEAAWEVEEILSRNPEFTLAKARRITPYKRTEDMEHYIAGLSKAGLSE